MVRPTCSGADEFEDVALFVGREFFSYDVELVFHYLEKGGHVEAGQQASGRSRCRGASCLLLQDGDDAFSTRRRPKWATSSRATKGASPDRRSSRPSSTSGCLFSLSHHDTSILIIF